MLESQVHAQNKIYRNNDPDHEGYSINDEESKHNPANNHDFGNNKRTENYLITEDGLQQSQNDVEVEDSRKKICESRRITFGELICALCC